jgi:cell division septation protein DedD
LANPTQDDGFHEIQLNGKQLVFLFMAATVVSVVIFLCGVLVGRGVRAERGSGTETTAVNDAPADITPTQPPPPLVPPAAGSDPTAAAAPPPAEDFTYPKRLEQSNQPQEDLKPTAKAASAPAPTKPATTLKPSASASAPPVPGTSPKPAPADAPSASSALSALSGSSASSAPPSAANDRAQAPAGAAADSQASGQGYVVQVTALNVRSEADAIAKHLTSKGYAAYVSANGTPTIYRVRVGSFKTRREAETIAAKLQKEEQMKPWVTK